MKSRLASDYLNKKGNYGQKWLFLGKGIIITLNIIYLIRHII